MKKSSMISKREATENRTIFACDVSKDHINLYTEIGGEAIELVLANKSKRIEDELSYPSGKRA